ncbi:uncharacterized protein RCC_05991 [Ramularia collo-cygni]|uniref:Uncharacterized protein n=1 Tax=Ramularia collo-cygni TaxID=112498 RepID=A0A2D3VBP2_9PEZI|nr:uncharacterized protein RCC_05991 [Ramularia collo-cygni]CZT20134.1 uncharacterized protein RCC_05991 [Ramularia collo-cygni]
MFDEAFTFDVARSPSVDSNNTSSTTRDTSRSVSPCSPTGPFPPPTYSVTDLAACFANSKMIRREAQICYDACDSYANSDDDAGWQIPTEDAIYTTATRSRTLPQLQQRSHSRTQRQASARLLCSTSHHKDIASLVSKMVESKEQCSVTASADSHALSIEGDGGLACDEGYDSSDAKSRRSSLAVPRTRLDYRRSSDLKTTGACVNKAVRFRNKQQKRIRGSENES